MKKLFAITIIIGSVQGMYILCGRLTTPKYPTYTFSGSVLVELPCGIGINRDMTEDQANELIKNPKTGLYPFAACIFNYMRHRDSN